MYRYRGCIRLPFVYNRSAIASGKFTALSNYELLQLRNAYAGRYIFLVAFANKMGAKRLLRSSDALDDASTKLCAGRHTNTRIKSVINSCAESVIMQI